MIIPRGHFAPPPRVDSAILKIDRRARPLIPVGKGKPFIAFATYLLREPRLAAAHALKGIFTPEQLKRTLKHAKLDREQAIYTLSPEQWSSLFTAMLQHVASYRWPKI